MKIHTQISDINKNQWQQLVDHSPNRSFFQTLECYQFFSTLSFLKPFVFAVSENDQLMGLVVGYIIADGNILKRYFSRRAIVPGGALLHPDISDAALQLLLKTMRNGLKAKAIYAEFRNYSDYSSFQQQFQSAKFEYRAHLNFHVSTPDVETSMKRLSTTKRRDVRLSAKEGATWYVTRDEQEIAQFYSILKNLYATKIKTPLFPLEFFVKLNQLANGKLFVVKYNGEIIGGSQCVVLPNTSVYEWFVCGLDGQFKNVFPSTISTWAGIEYAATGGIEKFDMMGAGKPDASYGVRDFKSKFGGELLEHGRFQFVFNETLYIFGKKIISLYKSLS